ncbi:MAG TPA: LOG family protein [Patescibacteria group bacterium]|nr:LOG family protein [Patescibacteria group bacterium]
MNPNQQSGVISVFGSHAPQPGSVDYESGREVGRRLAEAGYAVATGGYGGIMAAASQGAAEAGGVAIGITSRQVEKSRPVELNRWVQIETRYETLLERVEHLVKHNQGIIVMPGGIGTLSELALAWSLIQVKEIRLRPLILLGQMWADTMGAFSNPEYVAEKHIALIYQVWTPAEAVDVLLETSIQLMQD